MDGWLWETLFQPWIRNFQKQDEWWCPAPAVETPSTSEISNKDGNRNLWKTLKAFFSRVINLLLTKLARDRTGRISTIGLFCTDLAALGPYCQDLGPIFSQYGPRAWLIRYIYYSAFRVRIRIKRGSSSFSCSQTYGKTELQNSGLRLSFSTIMSIWMQNSFKRMISSSNFVAIARLVVLVLKDPWTTSPFLSLLAPVTLTCTLFSLWAWWKVNIKKESSIGTCPTSFISLKVSPNCVFIVFFNFFTVILPASACQGFSYCWRPCHLVNRMSSYNWRKSHFIKTYRMQIKG